MLVDNLRKIIISLMAKKTKVSDLYGTNLLKAEDGTVFDAYVNGETTNLFNYLTPELAHVKIAVGTGRTLPTVEDYKLEAKWLEVDAESIEMEHENTEDSVLYQGRFRAPETKKITEVGLFFLIKDDTGGLRKILVCREVFEETTWVDGRYYFIGFRLVI